MEQSTVLLLEKICNANAMLNTWLIWFERAFHEQNTYAPSVYQQRDAFNHAIDILTSGFYSKKIDIDGENNFNELLSDNHAKMQFDEIYDHLRRLLCIIQRNV